MTCPKTSSNEDGRNRPETVRVVGPSVGVVPVVFVADGGTGKLVFSGAAFIGTGLVAEETGLGATEIRRPGAEAFWPEMIRNGAGRTFRLNSSAKVCGVAEASFTSTVN